jgi:hypothetical protein
MNEIVPSLPATPMLNTSAARRHCRQHARRGQRLLGPGAPQLIYKFSRLPDWTERRLAEKEKALGNNGASPPYIHQKIVFGEILSVLANCKQGEMPSWLPGLSEGRFRKHWEMAKGAPDRDARFREVKRLLDQSAEWQRKSSNPVRKAIRDKYSDGKWHDLAVIAKAVDTEEPVVKDTLDRMTHVQAKDYKCERKVGPRKQASYRIFPH